MVVIPAGELLMGSPDDEPERYGEEDPQHRVVFARSFAMGRYAVTFEEYDRSCAATGGDRPDDSGWGRGNRPVINISWNDAVVYSQWLSEQTGQRYHLPSEAEWEHVCRAGTTAPFWWGNRITPKQANYDGNFEYAGGGAKGRYREKTLPVDSFEPNPWGLYQVHCNVWEWVRDRWHEDYDVAPTDESAWEEAEDGNCGRRVLRGGSWGTGPRYLRSAYRDRLDADNRNNNLDFRLAQSARAAAGQARSRSVHGQTR